MPRFDVVCRVAPVLVVFLVIVIGILLGILLGVIVFVGIIVVDVVIEFEMRHGLAKDRQAAGSVVGLGAAVE